MSSFTDDYDSIPVSSASVAEPKSYTSDYDSISVTPKNENVSNESTQPKQSWWTLPFQSTNKMLAGVADSVLNLPNQVSNLAKAGFGYATAAIGKPELSPAITPNPNIVTNAMTNNGMIQNNELTPAQRIADQTIQSGSSALLNPAGSLRQAISNIVSSSLSGAAGGVATEATGNPNIGAAVNIASPLAAKTLSPVVSKVGDIAGNTAAHVLGMTTGVGAENVKTAASSGANGQTDFWDNLTGKVPMTNVLDDAKSNLAAMGQAKQAEYRNGMAQVSNDKTILDFSGINKAVNDASKFATYKGQITNDAAAQVQQKLADVVNHWQSLDPAEFHTPEGVDALKKTIGGIVDDIPYNQKPALAAANGVYNAVKNEIVKQAPTYADTMQGYSDASDQIKEIEKAFSLNDRASADTAMRKLQSLSRNNVNTNYGNRMELAKQLQEGGGKDMMPALAGQAMNSWTPRGLVGQAAGVASLGGALVDKALSTGIPALSPRIVGAAAYGAGKGMTKLSDMANYLGVVPNSNPQVANYLRLLGQSQTNGGSR